MSVFASRTGCYFWCNEEKLFFLQLNNSEINEGKDDVAINPRSSMKEATSHRTNAEETMTKLDWTHQVMRKSPWGSSKRGPVPGCCPPLQHWGQIDQNANYHSWSFISLLSLPEDHLILVSQLSRGQISWVLMILFEFFVNLAKYILNPNNYI